MLLGGRLVPKQQKLCRNLGRFVAACIVAEQAAALGITSRHQKNWWSYLVQQISLVFISPVYLIKKYYRRIWLIAYRIVA